MDNIVNRAFTPFICERIAPYNPDNDPEKKYIEMTPVNIWWFSVWRHDFFSAMAWIRDDFDEETKYREKLEFSGR